MYIPARTHTREQTETVLLRQARYPVTTEYQGEQKALVVIIVHTAKGRCDPVLRFSTVIAAGRVECRSVDRCDLIRGRIGAIYLHIQGAGIEEFAACHDVQVMMLTKCLCIIGDGIVLCLKIP